MVICLIALPVFLILGIFSVKYRLLAKEAFRCFFKTVTLKPCDTGLDQKIKSEITARLMWWPPLASIFYNRFNVISWVFAILIITSTFFVGQGAYNYAVYGNCNGENSNQFCIFNVVRAEQPEKEACSKIENEHELHPEKIKIDGYPVRGDPDAKLTMVEYGCFGCPYTKKAEPVVRGLLKEFAGDVNLVYYNVPLSIHKYSIEASKAASCAREHNKYWEYHDILLENQDELSDGSFARFAQEIGLDEKEFSECFNSSKYDNYINESYNGALAVGIYGTPTFFINNVSLVGPQDYRTLKKMIKDELEK
ncbi:thioredoxin domain-containing protein [Candidatus Woesearchaeota archaeon]|nr:thioredoxin domain-containing protein [Candidatus Woesearchaeota archaeon]